MHDVSYRFTNRFKLRFDAGAKKPVGSSGCAAWLTRPTALGLTWVLFAQQTPASKIVSKSFQIAGDGGV